MKVSQIEKGRIYRTVQGYRYQVEFLMGGTLNYLILPGDSAKEGSGIEGRSRTCPVKKFAERVVSVERKRELLKGGVS